MVHSGKKISAIEVAHKVDIPAYFQAKWGRGWNVEGTIECFHKVSGIKKLDIQALTTNVRTSIP